MDKTEQWEDTMHLIRDVNRAFKYRQENARYIPVRDESTEFILGDYGLDDKGNLEDMDWQCQHLNQGFDEVDTPFMTFEGVKDYTTVVRTCDDCNATYNEIDEEWL
jgi:hypothetical protein